MPALPPPGTGTPLVAEALAGVDRGGRRACRDAGGALPLVMLREDARR